MLIDGCCEEIIILKSQSVTVPGSNIIIASRLFVIRIPMVRVNDDGGVITTFLSLTGVLLSSARHFLQSNIASLSFVSVFLT